jgi:hypothetical protein
LLLVGAGIFAMASVAAGSIISALPRMLPFAAAAHIGEVATSLMAFALVFGGILKVVPDVKLGWSDVWMGGLFVAVLFVVGKLLIGLYLAHWGKASAYGAAGSLALILLWTYYSALIFLLGKRDRRFALPRRWSGGDSNCRSLLDLLLMAGRSKSARFQHGRANESRRRNLSVGFLEPPSFKSRATRAFPEIERARKEDRRFESPPLQQRVTANRDVRLRVVVPPTDL